jgi:Ice-binding-like
VARRPRFNGIARALARSNPKDDATASKEITPMTQLSILNSNRSKTGAAVLLVSLATACGGTGGEAGDGGTASDGRSASDGKDTRDRASSADTGNGGDGDNTGDVSSDRGDMADAMATGDAASPLAVDLGAAGNFVVLAKSGISCVPMSAVTGDLGVSPAAASYITGFSLIADASKEFSTSAQVTGRIYASDYTPPTPSNLTTAIGDMQTAFTDAAGRAAGVTGLGAGDIGGKTLTPGVYKWSTGLLIPTDVTLAGDATAVWIFQIAKSLTVSDGTSVHLSGGAVAKNVFWQVSGAVELGTTSHFEGVILGKTAIALKTGASVHGRLLAQTAVSIEGSTVLEPSP